MRRFPHGGEVLGASPANPLLAPVLRPALELSRQQAMLDLQAIQRIPSLVGYWSDDPAYLFEDSGATTPASLNGVVGCWTSVGPAAIQATTAVKPYLRKTPVSNVYWLDSNTTTSALTATLGNLGSACTVAQAGAEGVAFTEGVTISSTYNIAPSYGFNGDVAIFNRALTVTEKALLTRYMQRGVPVLGSELLANRFATDISGWVANAAFGGSIEWMAPFIAKLIRTATGFTYYDNNATPPVIGSSYFMSGVIDRDTSSASCRLSVEVGGQYIVPELTYVNKQLNNVSSPATSNAKPFFKIMNSTGMYVLDNISIRTIL